jgi:hypothetical protein
MSEKKIRKTKSNIHLEFDYGNETLLPKEASLILDKILGKKSEPSRMDFIRRKFPEWEIIPIEKEVETAKKIFRKEHPELYEKRLNIDEIIREELLSYKISKYLNRRTKLKDELIFEYMRGIKELKNIKLESVYYEIKDIMKQLKDKEFEEQKLVKIDTILTSTQNELLNQLSKEMRICKDSILSWLLDKEVKRIDEYDIVKS